MRTRPIDRRGFLRMAGAGFLATLTPRAQAEALRSDAVFATAYQRRDGAFGVAILSERGALLHDTALPDRGHDITFDPVSGRSVVFARQPGTFAVVFDHAGLKAPRTLASVEGRHFYGHGVFSPDGALLYATENDFDKAAGVVGIYDATDDFRRVGEIPTHGIGPHELLLMPDGQTLAIANGGIETHPDFGRQELNLATMQPSLTFVDRQTGDLIERHLPPASLHRLSIRHMAVDGDGALWFGCQHRGAATETPPLVGRARIGRDFGLIDLPPSTLGRLRNYVGSVAANADAGLVAVSSPQGNSLAVLDARNGTLVAERRLTEVCGLAPDAGGFIASTGMGEIVSADGRDMTDAQHVWDNHMLRIA